MEVEAELFKQNPWWEGRFKEESHAREKYLSQISKSIKSKEILILTGLRRVGKTTILMQTIKELLIEKKSTSLQAGVMSTPHINMIEFLASG